MVTGMFRNNAAAMVETGESSGLKFWIYRCVGGTDIRCSRILKVELAASLISGARGLARIHQAVPQRNVPAQRYHHTYFGESREVIKVATPRQGGSLAPVGFEELATVFFFANLDTLFHPPESTVCCDFQ